MFLSCLEYFWDCSFANILGSTFSNLEFQAIYIWGHNRSSLCAHLPPALPWTPALWHHLTSQYLLVPQPSGMLGLLHLVHAPATTGVSWCSSTHVLKRQVRPPGHTRKCHAVVSSATNEWQEMKEEGCNGQVLQRSRTNRQYTEIYRSRCIMRNSLTQLWRQRHPTTCHLGNWWCRSKALRTRSSDVQGRNRWMS